MLFFQVGILGGQDLRIYGLLALCPLGSFMRSHLTSGPEGYRPINKNIIINE